MITINDIPSVNTIKAIYNREGTVAEITRSILMEEDRCRKFTSAPMKRTISFFMDHEKMQNRNDLMKCLRQLGYKCVFHKGITSSYICVTWD